MSDKMLFQTAVTETHYKDVEGVGRLRWIGDKCYRWVKNVNTSTSFAAGDVVTHDLTDVEEMLKYVDTPATADLGVLAGIVCGALAANTGTNPKCYGWIQVYGVYDGVDVTPVNTQTTAGPVAGAYLKAVNGQTYAENDASTQPSYRNTLQALEAVAAGTAVAATAVMVLCI